MSNLPPTMRSLVAPKFCKPSGYEVIDVALPMIKKPDDVLIRVHVGGVQTGDTQRARGMAKLLPGKTEFPMKMGLEGSGVVVAIGSSVTKFKVGDEVYGVSSTIRPMDIFAETSFLSQYAIAPESCVLPKPANLAHEDAATLLGFTQTAYQCAETALKLMRENGVTDGLEGKTVFVAGALSGTGSVAIQVLKNHYRVGKVISTVSTEKMPLVEKYLPNLVDQLIDYKTTKRLTDVIPAGSVDYVMNTQWDLVNNFALANPKTGVVVSISSLPHASLLREMMPTAPFWVFWVLTVAQWYYAFKLRGTNIKYTFVSGNFAHREDTEQTGEIIATGKVKAIKRVVNLEDIQVVRKACEQVYTGKGGIGKLVIKMP
ncbi:alcohol dehydrogenase [Xylaria cubensis]|nr:alcohol dehydrogenase [Xylaria cubensis]